MANDLSAPLGRKRGAAKPAAGVSLNLRPTAFPLARIAFGVTALIVVGVTARVFLVDDPMGGRPVMTIDVNGGNNANAIADNVAPTDTVTPGT